MGDVKNLNSKEAVEKIKQMAEGIDICLFATKPQGGPLVTRPMSTAHVDAEGNVWFLSRKDSNKNKEIGEDNHVQLFFSHPSKMEFLSVAGEAEITYDKSIIKKLWAPIDKAWFTEGEDDPTISAIKIAPSEAYYWDTKDNKMVSFVKAIGAMIAGKELDGGIEGSLKV